MNGGFLPPSKNMAGEDWGVPTVRAWSYMSDGNGGERRRCSFSQGTGRQTWGRAPELTAGDEISISTAGDITVWEAKKHRGSNN